MDKELLAGPKIDYRKLLDLADGNDATADRARTIIGSSIYFRTHLDRLMQTFNWTKPQLKRALMVVELYEGQVRDAARIDDDSPEVVGEILEQVSPDIEETELLALELDAGEHAAVDQELDTIPPARAVQERKLGNSVTQKEVKVRGDPITRVQSLSDKLGTGLLIDYDTITTARETLVAASRLYVHARRERLKPLAYDRLTIQQVAFEAYVHSKSLRDAMTALDKPYLNGPNYAAAMTRKLKTAGFTLDEWRAIASPEENVSTLEAIVKRLTSLRAETDFVTPSPNARTSVPRVVKRPPSLDVNGLTSIDSDGRLAWQERALCAQTDPEAFFPEKGGSTREAKAICLSCDVRPDCLHYALSNDERFGIWGGLSERERRKLKKHAV